MSGFDGTGPMGAGPMTGRGQGQCNPAGTGYRPAYGRGFGYGMGYGRGRGFRGGVGSGFGRGFARGFGLQGFYPGWGGGYAPAYGAPYPMDPSQEMDMLRVEADAMKSGLDEINRRIEELEKKSSE